MAGPLLLLASPLAIVAYYMLASVLTSYIAIRLIRTWGVVGRFVALFSRKERLPISHSATPAPLLVESSDSLRVRTSYVEWMTRLLVRIKQPALKLPQLEHQRIELPLSKEEESVKLEEARSEVPPVKEPPPPLIDLGDTASPMLGVFPGSSNVSACPTPEPYIHRHLPSPGPWRPGTTPPFTSTSSTFSAQSPTSPMTPPPRHHPLSPFASPKQMLKGKQRETFELGAFSQPLIHFSPVASPVPRVLSPHDRTRTPSPVYSSPHFLSTSPTSPFRPRRAMSLGAATMAKAPSFERRAEERVDQGWEPGRLGLLIDLGRLGDEVAESTMEPEQMIQCHAPTPIKPEAVVAFSFHTTIAESAHQEAGPHPTGEAHSVHPSLSNSRNVNEEEKSLPAVVVIDTETLSPRREEEFSLCDNPFDTDVHGMRNTTGSFMTALTVDWDVEILGSDSVSSLSSTPVVVDHPDDLPSSEESPRRDEDSPAQVPAFDDGPNDNVGSRASLDIHMSRPPSRFLPLDDAEGPCEDLFPDPEDLPLPSEPVGSFSQHPDPGLPELPSLPEAKHQALLVTTLYALALIGGLRQAEATAERLVDHSTIPIEDNVEAAAVAASTNEGLQSTAVRASGDEDLTINQSVIVTTDSVDSPPEPQLQGVRHLECPVPVVDDDKGPTSTSDSHSPNSSSSTAAPPPKPRPRATSGGFSTTILDAWRRGKTSPLDIALAMQMRPGLGAGADPAFMVRFLMAAFGWFVIVVNGGID